MGYGLGVDLGTTFTSAAVSIGGRVEAVNLGTRTAVLPTVVFARENDEVLVGDSAETRGVLEPGRVAREFKRRLGDTTPLILGGVAYSAEVLMGFVLQHVLSVVTERMGAAPDAVVVTHPATYTNYRLDLLRDAVARAGITNVELMAEPAAAALHYASLGRVPEGAAIAVYDLGGGTFDAAVLRRTGDTFEMLGEAKGLERLGGIDFDAAVLEHVDSRLGDQLGDVPDDPASRAGLARLRSDSRHAKEMLSADTETTIPVIVPGVVGNVTLTRRELESVLRPRIRESVAVLRSAIDSAGLQPSDLQGILLVGGSSRIPLVRVVLHAEFDVPITADVDPEMAVAFGAAQRATSMPAMAPRPLAPPIIAPPPPMIETAPPAPPLTTSAAAPAIPSDAPPARRRTVPLLVGIAVSLALIVVGVILTNGDDETAGTPTDPSATTPTDPVPDDSIGGVGVDCRRAVDLVRANGIRRQLRPTSTAPPCNLAGVNLSGADLGGFELEFADFTGSNLSGVILADAQCNLCDFTDADISDADLGSTSLSGADLGTADLESTRVEGATISPGTTLGRADVRISFINATGRSGFAADVTTQASVFATMGYRFGEPGNSAERSATTIVTCRGDQAASDRRKLVLYTSFVGGVVAAETDFASVESQVSGSVDAEVSCLVLLGSDFVLKDF